MKDKIGIIGGTGRFGQALLIKCILNNVCCAIGTRNIKKGNDFAKKIQLQYNKNILVYSYPILIKYADIIFLSIPHNLIRDFFLQFHFILSKKVIINVSVPINCTTINVERIGNELPKDVTLISGFQTISYKTLGNNNISNLDILLCGNNAKKIKHFICLLKKLKLKGIYCGDLGATLALEKIGLIAATKKTQLK